MTLFTLAVFACAFIVHRPNNKLFVKGVNNFDLMLCIIICLIEGPQDLPVNDAQTSGG